MSAFFNMPAVEKLLEDKGLAHAEISALWELVQLEWIHFDTVQGMSGRAACQDDAVGFFVHRVAQYLSFPRESIMAVRDDVVAADAAGRNVIREKYARMMEATDPVAFARDWSGVWRLLHRLNAVCSTRSRVRCEACSISHRANFPRRRSM